LWRTHVQSVLETFVLVFHMFKMQTRTSQDSDREDLVATEETPLSGNEVSQPSVLLSAASATTREIKLMTSFALL
jgi:hypothetical protein